MIKKSRKGCWNKKKECLPTEESLSQSNYKPYKMMVTFVKQMLSW